jgi:hypothetical protein
MIDVHCRTNLDLWREVWPKRMAALPSVGHRIQSSTIHVKSFQLELEVVSIKWKRESDCDLWYPEIELHIPTYRNWSLTDFYKWYAPLVGQTVGSFI